MKSTLSNSFDEIKLSCGLEFESEMKQITYDCFREECKVVSKKVARNSTKKQDRENGTDFFVWGVPVDFTLTIDTKDHCIISPTVMKVGGHDVRFGIRTGNNYKGDCPKNGYHEFPEPVLVIGVSGIVRSWLATSIEAIKKELVSIYDAAMDFYWQEYDKRESIKNSRALGVTA